MSLASLASRHLAAGRLPDAKGALSLLQRSRKRGPDARLTREVCGGVASLDIVSGHYSEIDPRQGSWPSEGNAPAVPGMPHEARGTSHMVNEKQGPGVLEGSLPSVATPAGPYYHF